LSLRDEIKKGLKETVLIHFRNYAFAFPNAFSWRSHQRWKEIQGKDNEGNTGPEFRSGTQKN